VQVERDAIVEIWKDASANNPVTWEEYMLNITKKGYSTILSAPWYLNYISYGQDWKTYYLEDPLQFTSMMFSDLSKCTVIGLLRQTVSHYSSYH
jgi:hexosaminidase